jgi:hypothetical protein
MSSLRSHPQREKKVCAWVDALPDGKEFHARQIAKSLNLMPVEVGNIIKLLPNAKKSRLVYLTGQIWQKIGVPA